MTFFPKINTFPYKQAESSELSKEKSLLLAVFTLCSNAPQMHTTVMWSVALVMHSTDKCLAELFTVTSRSSEDSGVDFLSSTRQPGQNQKSMEERSGHHAGHGFTEKRLITYYPNLEASQWRTLIAVCVVAPSCWNQYFLLVTLFFAFGQISFFSMFK